MEQFKQIGEVVGSLKALMIFQHEITINQRQCLLLFDLFNLAFDSIAEEIKSHLNFKERLTKWKPLEHPLRELHRVFRDGEQYIKNCIEFKEWWGRAISLNQSNVCVEFLVHNLLWCVPVVVEAIEAAGENSGSADQEEMNKTKIVISKKYDRDYIDPALFRCKFGKAYLISAEMCRRFESVVREDRWLLSEMISEMRSSQSLTKQESRLCELLLSPKGKIFPFSVLTGSTDYHVRRRLGGAGTNYKEIQWMGENFAMKHAIGEGEVERLMSEVLLHSSLAHPNVMSYMYAFCDEERRECLVVMDLMSKDLSSYVKEVCGQRKRVPIPVLVTVDAMLQISRGMEYLHSRKIRHGDLNPSNILVKSRNSGTDGYMLVKVANFGQSGAKNLKGQANVQATSSGETNPCIWYAPEVLSEHQQSEHDPGNNCKYSEKADVYSFAMICFELLTGKVPFEESHLQGDRMSRNIRAGERPLFPCACPKYLVSLTKRCWQADPAQRPSFSLITRVLRYVKRFLVMNPDGGQGEPPNTPVDYFDIEMYLSKRLSNWGRRDGVDVAEIPLQMYAYRVVERERTNANFVKQKISDSASEGASVCGDENGSCENASSEDSMSNSGSLANSSNSSGVENGKKSSMVKKTFGIAQKQSGRICSLLSLHDMFIMLFRTSISLHVFLCS